MRVEATRLRRAIERYYTGPGSDDPIIVDLPRGTYVPTFRRRDPPVGRIDPVLSAFRRWMLLLHQPPTLASIGAIAAIAVFLIAGVVLYERRDHATRLAGVHRASSTPGP